jgi:glucose-1-phosphate cytidylyltransferase
MLAWGDGVSDVNLHDLLAFHRSHGKLATMTVVHPAARFGHLDLQGDQMYDTLRDRQLLGELWQSGKAP